MQSNSLPTTEEHQWLQQMLPISEEELLLQIPPIAVVSVKNEVNEDSSLNKFI